MSQETQEQVSDLLLWSEPSAYGLMREIAKEYNISVDALAELVAWERESQTKTRKRGMTEVFDSVFENRKYWE